MEVAEQKAINPQIFESTHRGNLHCNSFLDDITDFIIKIPIAILSKG